MKYADIHINPLLISAYNGKFRPLKHLTSAIVFQFDLELNTVLFWDGFTDDVIGIFPQERVKFKKG